MTETSPSYRVLVVEDDAPLASMMADFLAPHGFDVSVEGRGDTAVMRIRDDDPDAVVLDVHLPGLDGFAVCKAVRAHYRGPIIMLTARGEEIDALVRWWSMPGGERSSWKEQRST